MSSQIWPIVPYGAFTLATPTIPKFYWDVYSQEQRWKTICCELGKLIDYANAIGMQVNINTEQIQKLWDEFEERKTPEAKFARTLDNIQPVMLNNASGGRSWEEKCVHLNQILKRNENTKDGSETLWDYAYNNFIKPNVENGK